MANYVQFMRGTTNAYMKLKELGKTNADTLYFLSDNDGKEGSLYLGTKLIAGPDIAGATMLGELLDVMLTPGMDYDAILMYDHVERQWRDYSFDALTFRAANDKVAGAAGFVPAPKINDANKFLRGDGTWATAGSECQIFNNIKTSVDQSHTDALSQATTGFILNKGDIAIIQDFIVDGKYQYTSYIFNGDEWCALDKEYNADNIYLKSNIADLETSGKNLTEAFELVIAQMQEAIIPDTTTITIDNNIVSIKDFGKCFYKYIPADDTYPAHYELQEVDAEHPWVAGLEPKVANQNGTLVLGWYEPNPTTIEGINSTITALQENVNSLSAKVDNTYTKLEIEEKIAAAPHLKRKVVDKIDDIKLDDADADQYIYMIPSGLEDDDNKYYEYIVIETKVVDGEGIETIIKSIERVGSWEVDLNDYAKVSDLNTKAAQSEVDGLKAVVYGTIDIDNREVPGLIDLVAVNKQSIAILTQDLNTANQNIIALTSGLKTVNSMTDALNQRADKADIKIVNLTDRADKVDSKITILENNFKTLDQHYVSIVNFNTVVGDMNQLLKQQVNILDEINDINQRLTWRTISEADN